MLRNDLFAQIEKDYNEEIKDKKYLSKGDNGSVSRITFKSGKKICVKSILRSNVTAETDYRITYTMYQDIPFDVKCYKDDTYIYFTMPFFPGRTLDELLEKNLPIFTRLKIFLKLHDEVCRMHKKGILHRDLKAPNVIVNQNGSIIDVNIIDVGRSVMVFNPVTKKPTATLEDLSLKNTVYYSHTFFQPIWQLFRKMQRQTAPEYTALTSHIYGHVYEGANVGFRSDYYSMATLFQLMFPEYIDLANSVIYETGPERNAAYFELIENVKRLYLRFEKFDKEVDAYVAINLDEKQEFSALQF